MEKQGLVREWGKWSTRKEYKTALMGLICLFNIEWDQRRASRE